MRTSRWLSGAIAASGLLFTVPAWADPPATANSIHLSGGFVYGLEMESGDFNPWGPGLGLSVGYTLPNALYAGVNFDYFFGDSESAPGIELSANIWQLMAELGYDLGVGQEGVLRPKAGIGMASINAELCLLDACASDSETYFAIAPGLAALYVGQSFSVGLDLRFDVIFADDETAKALIFSIGIGF